MKHTKKTGMRLISLLLTLVLAAGFLPGGILAPVKAAAAVEIPDAPTREQVSVINFVAAETNYLGGVALDAAGKVWTWGYNAYGMLGTGVAIGTYAGGMMRIPYFVDNDINIIQIAGGYHTSYAVSDKGVVYAWGRGIEGQMGNNTTTVNNPTPLVVSSLNGKNIIKVATTTEAASATYAIDDQGNVYAWGYADGNRINGFTGYQREARPLPEFNSIDVVDIELGERHGIALDSAGQIYTWGSNEFGQLGHGNTTALATPQKVAFFEGKDVVNISAESSTSMAVTSDGNAYVWGTVYEARGTTKTSYDSPGGTIYYWPNGGSSNVRTPERVEFDLSSAPDYYTQAPKAAFATAGRYVCYVTDVYGRVWYFGWNVNYGFATDGPLFSTGNGGKHSVHVTNATLLRTLGDGDTQGYTYSPKAPVFSGATSTSDFLTTFNSYNRYGQWSSMGDGLHPTIYDKKYMVTSDPASSTLTNDYPLDKDGNCLVYVIRRESTSPIRYGGNFYVAEEGYNGSWCVNNSGTAALPAGVSEVTSVPVVKESERSWIGLVVDLETFDYTGSQLNVMPYISGISTYQSTVLFIDNSGNLYKQSLDGSGSIAWGWDYSKYENGTSGNNAARGLYNFYNYEIMYMRGAPSTANPEIQYEKPMTKIYLVEDEQGNTPVDTITVSVNVPGAVIDTQLNLTVEPELTELRYIFIPYDTADPTFNIVDFTTEDFDEAFESGKYQTGSLLEEGEKYKEGDFLFSLDVSNNGKVWVLAKDVAYTREQYQTAEYLIDNFYTPLEINHRGVEHDDPPGRQVYAPTADNVVKEQKVYSPAYTDTSPYYGIALDAKGNVIPDPTYGYDVVTVSRLTQSFSNSEIDWEWYAPQAASVEFTLNSLDYFVYDNGTQMPFIHNFYYTGTSIDEPPIEYDEPPEVIKTKKPLVIAKSVDGMPFAQWSADILAGNLADLVAGMTFNLYKVDEKNAAITGDPVAVGTISPDGYIRFDPLTIDDEGWYAVVEELTGKAAKAFDKVGPMYIYVIEDGTMSSALSQHNVDGKFKVEYTAGYTWDVKLVYEDGTTFNGGAKPDGSGQRLATERFDVVLPDGTKAMSFCADLGAHNVFGNYDFDISNHNFDDDDMLYLIAALDYINSVYKIEENPGKALAQIVVWNLILQVDGSAGYADSWYKDSILTLIEGATGSGGWYIDEYKTFIDFILNNRKEVIDIYDNRLIDFPDSDFVSGVIFITGDREGYSGIDQQRQILVLFNESMGFKNIKSPATPIVEDLEKAADPRTFKGNGDEIEYTISFTMPENLTGFEALKIVDVIPDELSYVPDSASLKIGGGVAAPVTMSFDGDGNLYYVIEGEDFTDSADKFVELTLIFKIDGWVSGDIENTAELYFKPINKDYPDLPDVEDDETIYPPLIVDDLEKTAQPGVFKKNGDEITYTISFTMPDDVSIYEAAKIVDVLPENGLSYQDSASLKIGDGAEAAVVMSKDGDGNLYYELTGEEFTGSAGKKIVLMLAFKVDGWESGNITNTAELYFKPAGGDYPDEPDIKDDGTIYLLPTDLLKTTDRLTYQPGIGGQTVEYTISFTLPDDLRGFDNFRIADRIPTGLSYADAASLKIGDGAADETPAIDTSVTDVLSLTIPMAGLTGGDKAILKLTFNIDIDADGTITNIAELYCTLTGKNEEFVNDSSVDIDPYTPEAPRDPEPASVTLNAKKTVSGAGAALATGQFSFGVFADDAQIVTQTNDGDGNIVFPVIKITQAGTYTYIIKETMTSANGWVADATECTVTVTVTNNGGQLVAEVEYPDDVYPTFNNQFLGRGGYYPDRPTTIIEEAPPLAMFIPDHAAYIIGYPEGDVRPERNITRAEVATVFFRLLSDELRAENWVQQNAFPDVISTNWFNNAVSVMSRMGIVNGYPNGTFMPDGPITRGELAAIAARFARATWMMPTNDRGFSDISGHWAQNDILYAAAIGWVNGYPDGTYRPNQPITRAEFMTLVNRMLERVPETADDLLASQMKTWVDNSDTSKWYYLAVQEATNSHSPEYKSGRMVPDLAFEYERWLEMVKNRDWEQLEKAWSTAYSG